MTHSLTDHTLSPPQYPTTLQSSDSRIQIKKTESLVLAQIVKYRSPVATEILSTRSFNHKNLRGYSSSLSHVWASVTRVWSTDLMTNCNTTLHLNTDLCSGSRDTSLILTHDTIITKYSASATIISNHQYLYLPVVVLAWHLPVKNIRICKTGHLP